jgi:hypothetical protein
MCMSNMDSYIWYRPGPNQQKNKNRIKFGYFLKRLSAILLPQAKVETRALKAKRPGFTDERYNETSYYFENGNFETNYFFEKDN